MSTPLSDVEKSISALERERRSRDAKGQPRDSAGRFSAVSQLAANLGGITDLSLNDIVPRYHWFHGTSGVMSRDYNFADRIHFEDRPWYRKVLPEKDRLGSFTSHRDKEIERIVTGLSSQDHETLHRLAYGDIPASWNHDPLYIKHLLSWAKKSKLIDKLGLPYRLFHGTGAEFRQFDPKKRGSNTTSPDAHSSFFLTASPEDAGFFSVYGLRHGVPGNDAPSIYPVYARLQKPLYVIDKSGRLDVQLSQNAAHFSKENGYDGLVIYKAIAPAGLIGGRLVGEVRSADGEMVRVYSPIGRLPRGDGMVVSVQNADDIKSASGNEGAFDERIPDMGKSLFLPVTTVDDDGYLKKSVGGKRKKAIEPKKTKSALKAGQVIAYTHPNYPTVKRQGKVLAIGNDGCLVYHHGSGIEEKVRHEHIVGTAQKDEKNKELAKSFPPTGGPFGGISDEGKPKRLEGEPDWKPVVTRYPYEVGHGVKYQRPDMHEPRIGRIDAAGKHGAVVSLSEGGRHKVRWSDIHGRVEAGFVPEERGLAAEALESMGVKVDPLEKLITGRRANVPDAGMLGKVEALSRAGVPVDTAQAAFSSPEALKRLLAHLTESRPKK